MSCPRGPGSCSGFDRGCCPAATVPVRCQANRGYRDDGEPPVGRPGGPSGRSNTDSQGGVLVFANRGLPLATRRLPRDPKAAGIHHHRVLTLAVAAGVALGATQASALPTAAAATDAQLIGQKLMVAMAGTTPSASLLGRIQRGEVGGVILFGSNITGAAQLASLTRTLRQAATTGGQPPLLIATDQEGGSVKRVPWAPPTLSVPQMGSLGSTSTATAQGAST